MTRASCLGTVKCIVSNIYLKKKRDPFDFIPSICWTSCQNSTVI